jgi:hypothetical protein
MFFADVPDVTIQGLRGDLTVVVQEFSQDHPNGVDVAKEGDSLMLCLSFVGGVSLRVQPRLGRPTSPGRVTVTAPPGVNFQLIDCEGRLNRPGGASEDVSGDSKFST